MWELFKEGFQFLDFANRYTLNFSPILPNGWSSYNWSQIAAFAERGNNTIGQEIRAYADAFTTVICKVDGDRLIRALEAELPTAKPSSPPSSPSYPQLSPLEGVVADAGLSGNPSQGVEESRRQSGGGRT